MLVFTKSKQRILFVEDTLLYFDIVHLGHCKNIMQCYITDVNIR